MTDIDKEALEAARILSKYCAEHETCLECMFRCKDQSGLYYCMFNDTMEDPPCDWRFDKI